MDMNDQLAAQYFPGDDAGVHTEAPAGAVDIHAPFTKVERFQQLTEIDQDITAILEHTGNAVKALAKPQVSNANGSADESQMTPDFDPQERLATFKEAMDAVMVMLHSVDTRLKRQIYGLEEAGIITLPTAAQRAEESANPSGGIGTGGSEVVKASLKPNGVGKIGTLDVGILNANNSAMERDMESELWVRAREHLEDVAKSL